MICSKGQLNESLICSVTWFFNFQFLLYKIIKMTAFDCANLPHLIFWPWKTISASLPPPSTINWALYCWVVPLVHSVNTLLGVKHWHTVVRELPWDGICRTTTFTSAVHTLTVSPWRSHGMPCFICIILTMCHAKGLRHDRTKSIWQWGQSEEQQHQNQGFLQRNKEHHILNFRNTQIPAWDSYLLLQIIPL